MRWMPAHAERAQRIENLALHTCEGALVPLLMHARGWPWQWGVVVMVLFGPAWELGMDALTHGRWRASILGAVAFAVGAAIACAVILA